LGKKIISIVAAMTVFGGVYFSVRHHSRSRASAPHPLAPEFSLPGLTGETIRLSDYRGTVVLLDFWATWCEPCREEIPGFVELQDKYRGQGLQIIGVSMDDGLEPVRDFRRHFQMNYPVAVGNAKIGELYGGVLGLPIAFLIGRDGRIYAKHIGAVDIPVLEKEITSLLGPAPNAGTSQHEQLLHRLCWGTTSSATLSGI
jgi:peroxiredoxin